jgi:hypothetical protein
LEKYIAQLINKLKAIYWIDSTFIKPVSASVQELYAGTRGFLLLDPSIKTSVEREYK